ncbi:MAG: hypothetical protein ORN29_08840, partial [Rhodoferax sp.]|nr:hypothetical protein [Rhodoferax sp.]
LLYQWKRNGKDIPDATSRTYTTPAATVADNGTSYSVSVSNGVGSPVTSGTATLTVSAVAVAPTITSQPASLSVTADQVASFSVTAKGTGTLTYQWKKDGADIAGATSSSYSTTATTGGVFTVVVGNGVGSPVTSSPATLTVTPVTPVEPVAMAPVIGSQPMAQTVSASRTATFSVTATGTAPLIYQWQKNGINIAGATSSTYTTPVSSLLDSGETYSVSVSNNAGTVTSNPATLTVTPAQAPGSITIADAPVLQANSTLNPYAAETVRLSIPNQTVTISRGLDSRYAFVVQNPQAGFPNVSGTLDTLAGLKLHLDIYSGADLSTTQTTTGKNAAAILDLLPIPGTTAPSIFAASGSTVTVTFTDSSNQSITKTVTGKGGGAADAVTVNWSVDDQGSDNRLLREGVINVSMTARDAANHVSPAGSGRFILDTTPPATSFSSETGLVLNASSHQYASLSASAVDVSADMTLVASVFSKGTQSDNARIFDFAAGANTNKNVIVGFKNSGKLFFEAFDASGTSLGQTVGSTVFPTDSWHKVAVVVGSGNTPAVTIYVDDTAVATTGNSSLSAAIPAATRSSSFVGHSNFSADPDFNGAISYVCIFDNARAVNAPLNVFDSNVKSCFNFLASASNSKPGIGNADATLVGSPVFSNPSLTFSNDTGKVGDYIVTAAAATQTITAKLRAALAADEKVWGSLDGGSTWLDLSSYTSGTTVTWTGATLLSGTHDLKLSVRDSAGNSGPILVQAYTVN